MSYGVPNAPPMGWCVPVVTTEIYSYLAPLTANYLALSPGTEHHCAEYTLNPHFETYDQQKLQPC